MSEPLDIALFYADLGKPYLPHIQRTITSARRMMPDSRTVLLTTTPSEDLAQGFDLVMALDAVTTDKTLCLDKARAIATWQARLDRPCLFVDPDLEFRRPVPDIDEDVGLLWRERTAQPVNAGLIYAKPGCPMFWRKYAVAAAMLPPSLHGWWCDQLAFSVMLGSLRRPGEVVQAHDARVRLIPMEEACAPPDKAAPGVWAHHFKGARKGVEFERQHRVETGEVV